MKESDYEFQISGKEPEQSHSSSQKKQTEH